MKKRLASLLLAALFVLPLLSGAAANAANVADYQTFATTFNSGGVTNSAKYYPRFKVDGENILLQAVTTYHYNDGRGSPTGSISIYETKNGTESLLGTWPAVGRGVSPDGTLYWDIFPNVVLKDGCTYRFSDSMPSTWSSNEAAQYVGFIELRGIKNYTGGSTGGSGGSGSTGGSTAISVTVGGRAVQWTDAAPFIDANSRTMVPLRAVADALGLTVGWDAAAREASFSDGAKAIYFPIGSRTARTSGGGAIQMDTAAVIVNSRTYAPIRPLAEFFGYTVGWDGSTRTVALTGGSTGGSGGSTASQYPADFSAHMYITNEWDGKTGGGNTNHPDAFVTVRSGKIQIELDAISYTAHADTTSTSPFDEGGIGSDSEYRRGETTLTGEITGAEAGTDSYGDRFMKYEGRITGFDAYDYYYWIDTYVGGDDGNTTEYRASPKAGVASKFTLWVYEDSHMQVKVDLYGNRAGKYTSISYGSASTQEIRDSGALIATFKLGERGHFIEQ